MHQRLVRALIYHPRRSLAAEEIPARFGVTDADTLRFATANHQSVFGWWLPARGNRQACGAAIVFYGNEGNLVTRAPLGVALATRGLDVLLFDYRGFGASPGTPSETTMREDGRAAYGFVRSRGIRPERILLIGHSLGTAIALDVASRFTVGGVILLAPFTSLDGVVRERLGWFPASILPDSERFESLASAASVRAPALAALGENDRLIPRADAQQLYNALGGTKEWVLVQDVGHNNILTSEPLWWRVERFQRSALRCE